MRLAGKLKIMSLIALAIGALLIPVCDGDATGFFFCVIFFAPLLFVKNDWLNQYED